MTRKERICKITKRFFIAFVRAVNFRIIGLRPSKAINNFMTPSKWRYLCRLMELSDIKSDFMRANFIRSIGQVFLITKMHVVAQFFGSSNLLVLPTTSSSQG